MKSNFDKHPFVTVTGSSSDCIVGWDAICSQVNKHISAVKKDKVVVAIDSYQGVIHDEVLSHLRTKITHAVFIQASDALKKESEILEMIHPDVTDDQIFGYMTHLTIDKYFDATKLSELRKKISDLSKGVVIVYGDASAYACQSYDLLFYLDMASW
jgi:hypothetical protein